jgi:LPXTG-motif cell wall-anchored protein
MRFQKMNVNNLKQAYRVALQLLCVSLLSFALAPRVHADGWDKQTKFTFTEPIQVPGKVLPAGTYVFRLLNSTSDRHVVQIYDETGRKLVTTVLAIPNYQLEPKGRTVVKFDERPAGSPEALKAWFYPGDNFGQEFVYEKDRYLQSATVATATTTEVAQNTTPVEEPKPAAVVEPAPVTTAPEPATPVTPVTNDDTPAPAQAVAPTPAPAPEASTPPAEVTPAPAEPENLPKTGSELPLVALLGLASLGSGIVLRHYRHRAN